MALPLDPSTPFGARATQRLGDESLAWLVTVSPAGQPQPSRIWFLVDDDGILLYSKPDTPKLRNLATNDRVSINLDGDDRGGSILVVHGRAAVSGDASADANPAYVAKYLPLMEKNGWSPADFAAMYSVPVRVLPTRIHGW